MMNELRHEMASLGKGAWLSTVLHVTSEGHFRFSFNYDDKPAWFAPLEDAAYIEDLQKYPRPPEAVPAWYPRVPEA
ncbi:antitoxin YezG family protein [Mycolicibacterium aubagnense]|uniref:immunity protein YezG family protein n=1 Tax=Mycolicibacterium aubagnense TaxID=319707 RepID=UPI0013CF76D8